MEKIIIVIRWLPTALFLLGLVIPILQGLKRGYRRSMKLLIHSVVLSVIFISLYLIICTTDFGDSLILKLCDLILGGEGSLKATFGITSKTETFREVLIEIVVKYLGSVNFAVDLASVIESNGIYIETLVNLLYHTLFATLFYILYLLFNGLVTFITFLSDYKYKYKQNKLFRENKEYSTYKHNSLGGFFVGLGRGIIKSFVFITFIGSYLFMLSGDAGYGTLSDVDLENDDAQFIYDVYQEVDNYSNHGIFKVLSTFTDNDGTPVYLEIPDLIMSGKVSKNGTTKELNIREEMSSYTSLAKSLITSVCKADESIVTDFLNGNITSSEFLNKVYSLVDEPVFQASLVTTLSDFSDDSFTYDMVVNVSDSLIKYINLNSVDSTGTIVEPINILFNEGYLSDSIEEEQLIKKYNQIEDDKIVFKTISASDLLNKKDLVSLVKIAFNVIPTVTSTSFSATDIEGSIIPLVKSSLNLISSLSIFNENDGMNESLARLYRYAEVVLADSTTASTDDSSNENAQTISFKYTDSDSGTSSIELTSEERNRITSYVNDVKENFDWYYETSSLFNLIEDITKIYKAYNQVESSSIIDKVLGVLNNSETKEPINNVFDYLQKSSLIGETLSLSIVSSYLETALKSFLGSSYVLPNNLTFNNTCDESGNVTEYGEMYYIFGLLNFILNPDNSDLYNSIISLFNSGSDTTTVSYKMVEEDNSLDKLQNILSIFITALSIKDEYNHDLKYYLVNSNLFRSILSGLLVNYASSYLYIPSAVKELQNSVLTTTINKEELSTLIDAIPSLVENVLPLFTSSSISIDSIIDLLTGDSLTTLLKSKIIQSTIGNFLISYKDNLSFFVFPSSLTDAENWCTNGENESELIKLINAINLLNIDFSSDNLTNIVTEKLFEFAGDDNKIETLLDSEIIYYTISSYIDPYAKTSDVDEDAITIMVPVYATNYLDADDSLNRIITVSEFKKLFKILSILNVSSFNDLSTLLADSDSLIGLALENKDLFLDSSIISTTIVLKLVPTLEGMGFTIPTTLKEKATIAELKNYSILNPWYSETKNLFNILYILMNGEETLNVTNIINNATNRLINFNDPSGYENYNNFDFLMSSSIIKAKLSTSFDEVVANFISDSIIREQAKYDGSYQEEEIKSLLDLLNKNGINNLEAAQSFNYSNGINLIDISSDTCGYYIIRGLITSIVDSSISNIHPYAYDVIKTDDDGTKHQVLKKKEIITLVNLLTNYDLDNTVYIANFDSIIENLTIKNVLSLIGSTECESYLLIGISSNIITQFDSLVIPKQAIDVGNYLTFKEMKAVLNALSSISESGSDTKVNDINIDPSSLSINQTIMKSDIFNATIFKNIIDSLSTLQIEKRAVIKTKDTSDNNILLLSANEIAALSGVDLSNIQSIVSSFIDGDDTDSANKDKLFQSSIIRIYITNELFGDYEKLNSYINSPLNTTIHTYKNDIYEVNSVDDLYTITLDDLLIFTQSEINSIKEIDFDNLDF